MSRSHPTCGPASPIEVSTQPDHRLRADDLRKLARRAVRCTRGPRTVSRSARCWGPLWGGHLRVDVVGLRPRQRAGRARRLAVLPGHEDELVGVVNFRRPAIEVSAEDPDAALDELLDTRNSMTRILLGGSSG